MSREPGYATMVSFIRGVAFVLFAACVLSGNAFAQGGDVVPRELALALLRAQGEGVRLLVGNTPDRFPFELAPANAKLLGSAQRDRVSMVVYVSKLDAPAARIAWEDQMQTAGWTRPRSYSQGPTNGLISSESPSALPSFCSKGMLATLTSSVRYEGGSTLLVTYTEPTMQSLCSVTAAPADAQFTVAPDTIPVPALLPPPDVTVVSYNGPSSVDSWEQLGRISGALSSAKLLEHYAVQMTKAGWSASAAAVSDGAATQTYRFKLPQTGFDVVATLVIMEHPFDNTNKNARITIHRRRP